MPSASSAIEPVRSVHEGYRRLLDIAIAGTTIVNPFDKSTTLGYGQYIVSIVQVPPFGEHPPVTGQVNICILREGPGVAFGPDVSLVLLFDAMWQHNNTRYGATVRCTINSLGGYNDDASYRTDMPDTSEARRYVDHVFAVFRERHPSLFGRLIVASPAPRTLDAPGFIRLAHRLITDIRDLARPQR